MVQINVASTPRLLALGSRHLTGSRGHRERAAEDRKVTDAEPALIRPVRVSEMEPSWHVWYSHTSVSPPLPQTPNSGPDISRTQQPGVNTCLALTSLVWFIGACTSSVVKYCQKHPGHNRHTNKTLPEPRGRRFQEPGSSWRK